jgi:hypothetical protein
MQKRPEVMRAKRVARKLTVIGVAPPSQTSDKQKESSSSIPNDSSHRYSLVRVRCPDGIPGITGHRSADLRKIR